MAQTIQLPLNIRFVTARRKWVVRRASLVELFRAESLLKGIAPLVGRTLLTTPQRIALKVEAHEAGWLSALAPTRQYEFLPFGHAEKIRSIYAPGDEILKGAYDGPLTFEVVVSLDCRTHAERPRDPWKMREEFLALEQSSSALAAFLSKWGDWDFSGLRETDGQGNYPLGNIPDGNQIGIAVPELLWERQAFYKAALSGKATDWLAMHAQFPKPQRQLQPPFFASTDRFCFSAIETTITVDKIRDVPYRICQRHDCGKVFELTTKHKKQYCSQDCAHLVSVRRGREALRKQKPGMKENK